METSCGGTNYTGWAISILEGVGCFLVFQKGETHYITMRFSSVQSFSRVGLCDPMDCSTPGFPVYHQLLKLAQIRPSNRWCHPTISSSVLPFSSCHQCYVWSWWGYCLLLLTPPLTGSHWEAWILSYLSILKPWHNARVYVRISKWPWRIHLNAQELSWNFLEVSCLKLQSLLTIQLNLGTSCDWAI